MKRTLFLLLMLTLVALLTLSACSKGDDKDKGNSSSNDENISGNFNNESVTFDIGETVSIVVDDVNSPYAADLQSELFYALGRMPIIVTPEHAPESNALILGDLGLSLSKKAYSMMERTDKESNYTARITVYSDGRSVAIAYEDLESSVDYTQLIIDTAVEFFCKSYIAYNSKIHFNPNHCNTHTFDVLEEQASLDKAAQNSAWSTVEAMAGIDATNELKSMYNMFTPKVLNWLADLYDVESGGFYYSNSGRNYDGYLPDIESTAQAIDLLKLTGMFNEYGNDPSLALPDWFKAKLVAFIKGMQDPNGYFYHPQWTRAMVDGRISRRSRDLTKGLDLLKSLGAKPTYDALGVKGDGILADGTPVGFDKPISYNLTDPLGSSLIRAVSKVVPTSSQTVPPNIASKEAFTTFLYRLDLKNDSYAIGNDLASQSAEIKARDEYLASIGADYRLKDILQSWLYENCYENTGHWSPIADYDGLNGFMKISAACSSLGIPLKYPEAAARSAINAITTDEYNVTVCYAYNAWFSINNIFSILNKCHPKEEAERIIASIKAELKEKAPELIRATAEKQSIFLRDDGSFSYTETATSSTSQGMPVAVPGMLEGDINATLICIADTAHQMFSALGYERVPIFGKADLTSFLDRINELGPIIKKEETVVVESATFDEEKLGSTTEEVNIYNSTDSTFTVIKDTRPGATSSDKVLEFDAKAGGGKRIRLPMSLDANSLFRCYVFEGEFNFVNVPKGAFATLMVGPNCYLISFTMIDGAVYLYEQSSDGAASKVVDLKTGIAVGEWFKIKVEYFYANADEVRIKLYVNDELISVSDNFYDRDGDKLDGGNPTPDSRFEGADFFVYSYYDAKILLDNLKCYKKNEQYIPALDPEKQPLFNVDAPDRDKIVYDFENDTPDTLPGSVTVSGAAVIEENNDGKHLKFNGASSVKLPVNIRTAGANSTSVELDITVNSDTVGKIFDITFTEDSIAPHDIVKYNAEIADVDGTKYLVLYAAPTGSSDKLIDGAIIPINECHKLRIEYYDGIRVALFYIDSNLVASCDILCQDAKKYTVGQIVISTTASADIVVDNIVSEKNKKNFDNATKPGTDSIVHDFENGSGDVILSGGAAVSGSSDKYLSLTNGSKTVFPINERSVIINVLTFAADIKLESSTDAAYLFSFVDSNGATLLSYELRVTNGKAGIYEKTKNNTYTDPLCYITKGSEINLSLIYYPQREIAYLLSGGVAIAKSSLAYSEETRLLAPASLVIEALSGSGELSLDNVKVESSSETYVPRDVKESENTEDDSTVITYEGSSTGNIPEKITASLSSSDSSIAIREVLKKNSYSKVLEFNTRPGRQDALTFGLNKTAADYTATVFETEFKFTFKPNKVTSFQIFLEDGDNIAYIINLSKKDDTIVFSDLSSLTEGKIKGKELSFDKSEEWHKIRIEYYNGTRDTVRIKTYIDDQLIRVSDNFGGKEIAGSQPYSTISRVRIMSYGDTYATLMTDNVSLVQAVKECVNDPLTDETTPPVTPENPNPDTPKPEEPDEPTQVHKNTITFENDVIGATPSNVTSSNNDAYSYISVIADPRKSAEKVLKFHKANTTPEDPTYVRNWPVVTIPRTTSAANHNVTVFEADLRIDYIQGRLDTTYQFYLGAKANPAYSFRINLTKEHFNFIDSSNDTSGISSPAIETASMPGKWFNLRIEFFEGDQSTAKIMVYMDNALIYVSRNFYGPMSTDAAGKKYTVNNDITEFRITTWGDTQGIMLIDNASLYETTLTYPANPYGIPSGKVYPQTETEDFDVKVLPVKGGANGIITLNTDISADKKTITVLDRVAAKYNLKADIAVVVDNLMENAGVGTNTEEKTPNSDIINFINAKLAGGRLKLMNHGLTHVFWADTETGEKIDWEFFNREFVGSKDLLRTLFPSQRILTFVLPGYAWIVDMHGEQIYDEVYEVLKKEYIADRYYDGTAANIYDWNWEKTPAHQILPDNDAQTFAVIDSVARGDGRFANLFLYHLDEDTNFDNGTTNGGTETYFYQRESRLDAICKRIAAYVETGAVWQTNYEDAMLYLREAENASVTITRKDTITIVLEDGLDDEIYNYPLSVRVQLDESYEAVKVTQNGKVSYAVVKAQNGIYFADIDVIPNSSEAVVEKVAIEDVPEEFLPSSPETSEDGSIDFGGNNKDDNAWS